MPRKPSFSHALRQVREAVGKTQSDFAQMVGCSAPTIRGIENGQRHVTQELAERILDVTGAWPFCLTENWDEACDLYGDPYTPVSFLRFKEGLDDEVAAKSAKWVIQGLDRIFDAAAKAGKSSLALYYTSKAIAEVFARLNLDDALYRVHEEISARSGPRYTVRELRSQPDMAKSLGFHDDPSLKDDELHYVKITPEYATQRSPHRSRWDTMDVEAPWFIAQGFAREGLSGEERKIYDACKVKVKCQNRQAVNYKKQMAAEEVNPRNL